MLLSNMMRAQAITGRTGYVDEWLAGRQFGRWSYRPPSKADPAKLREALTELHERGVIDDAELEKLRGRSK